MIVDCVGLTFGILLQFFLAPPECCPSPRWFSNKFSEVYDAYDQAVRDAPANVHLVPLYKTEPGMFELDGRHLKSYVGKDYVDHLIHAAEAGMIKVSLDTDERLAKDENRVTVLEGRVDLVRRDFVRSDQRLNVVVARAAEEADAAVNEK